jgi:hypothetical protein
MKTHTLTLAAALLAASLASAQEFHNVTCEGVYEQHLQGICVDKESIYWSFTTELVKTDLNGKLLKKVTVQSHHGDLCIDKGKLCVAVNLGKFNDPQGNADSWIYVYNADDLSLAAKHKVAEVFYGAGGIGVRGGHFYVVGGLPDGTQENYIYEYDGDFKFLKKHAVKSGHTFRGIQTATFAGDRWWFGCYGEPKILLVTDADFNLQGRYEFDCSLGIVGLPDGRFLCATRKRTNGKGQTARLQVAVADRVSGLRLSEK